MILPDGYQQVMPYIIVKDAARFLEFLHQVFDACEKLKSMRDENLIMHAEITIGESTIMVADATEKFSSCTAGLFVYVDDADDTFLKAISAGATSVMHPTDQPYGRSCGIADPFGNTWWITSVEKNV